MVDPVNSRSIDHGTAAKRNPLPRGNRAFGLYESANLPLSAKTEWPRLERRRRR